ncbi:DNA polymerase I [Clostridium thermarum]|uniref:DNA polymerase I n=1 Tax=Clostridium thermarum TaxID=1716543 RepID=UPI00111FB05F|nr:DNA polymerase I [Clostridium thermarum]
MEKLLILDGHSLMNRAFYGVPPLTNAEGLHTNAIFGFTNMLLKIKEEIKPDYIVTTFDRKAPTFRHKEYEDYKAGRKKMPPELHEQFEPLKELLKLMSINIFEIDGFEADDLIGTLAKYAESQDIEVFILTGDRDALQLASDNIKVIITKKGITDKEIYDRKRMIEDFGVTPTQFIDVKGLMGDASDNIPGVPGIGEKTAYKLIQEYGSVENVLSNIEKISGKKIKESLMENTEMAIFSKKLATIMTDVPIEINLDEIKSKDSYNLEGIRKFFFRMQFKSLLDRLPSEDVNVEAKAEEQSAVNYKLVDNILDFKQLTQRLQDYKGILYITPYIENETMYSKLNLEHFILTLDDENNYVVELSKLIDENREVAIKCLVDVFSKAGLKKVGYDMKNCYTALQKLGVEVVGLVFDIKLAAYLIDASKGEYPLIGIIHDYIGVEVKGQGIEYEVRENMHLPVLHQKMSEKLKEFDMEKLYYDVELPLSRVLANMESEGFKVSYDMLEELSVKFKAEIETTQKKIYELADEEFNINSPKQLGKILFEKLDLPAVKKTKTGYSTNAEVLEQLSDKHPLIEKILYYRQITKLYSTYIEGLKNVLDEDGKIHSNFNQTVTTTGRLSSTEPNLQNIPIKYEMGKEIRKVFHANDEDSVILSADYSQIELRVLAHIAGDENLINAFLGHSDIHTKTASEVFKVPLEEVTPLMRSRAKAVNFGIVYGISDFSLAKDLKITKAEAKSYMDTYFERYPGVRRYMDTIIEEAQKKGYVTTVLNRRRYIPEVNASNKIMKALGERLAMNAPIQGSAADIIKLAMVNVYNKLKEGNYKSTLILQVHDELILNVYKDEEEEIRELVKREMEEVMDLSVPMEVDISVGKTWYDAK